jgi:hypothetical protein
MKMKTIAIILATVCFISTITTPANADVYVRGYYRSSGTYVQPHYRSNPDGNFSNNWSTYGNVNPYTGSVGTRLTPSYSGSYSSPSYGTITTMPYYSYRSYGR